MSSTTGVLEPRILEITGTGRIAVFGRTRLATKVDQKMSSSGPDFSRGDGLLPAIVQDADSGEVLMLAYMNAESFSETLRTGRAVFYSRSRKRLWRKGEESGHVQLVREVLVDCDLDTILLKVQQVGGAACHEGYRSCFYRQVTPQGLKVVAERVFDPAVVYEKASAAPPGQDLHQSQRGP
jgi:phosphoribosyl-AMP cyclohydrolase